MSSEISRTGKAWRFGDNISTDDIISGVHLDKLDLEEVTKFTFEALHPAFPYEVKPNDFVVAGHNFGIGSSREEAAIVFKLLEVGAIIATSFARLFFRNAYNIGLPAVEIPLLGQKPDLIQEGDELTLHLVKGTLVNHRTNESLTINKIPPFLIEYIRAGGALALLKHKRGE